MKKTLMVDMDNVITDGKFFEYICDFLKQDLDINDVKNYYLQDLVEDQKKEFWDYLKDKNFYANSLLKENCLPVLKKLNEKYELYIVTAYLWKDEIDISGENLKNKYNYLTKELPFIHPKQFIFTTNKNIMNFDIRIDDRINNLTGAKTKLLFDAWHNRDILKEELEKENVIRVKNWNEIESILEAEDEI